MISVLKKNDALKPYIGHLQLDKYTGKVEFKFIRPDGVNEKIIIVFAKKLAEFFKLETNFFQIKKVYIGMAYCRSVPFKIQIHLEEISRKGNFLNGRETTILDVLTVHDKNFRQAISYTLKNQTFKPLQMGMINGFTFKITDEENVEDNSNVDITIETVIRKKA